ncbi:MAG: gliding motility-associated ABC transporter substrate-binding protein GldG, partial [Bacteroidia bacterium]|nr:gliding motility-associated ABC transporter substrate-binding protein GldG [Bacteroidia bacterium]
MKHKKKSTRKKEKSLINLFAGILVIFLINLIGSQFYERIDLTAEKRYTLSSSTLEMLKSLDDIVFFKIYLEGDFPAGFKRLRNETRELLRQFNAYNKNIQFEFIDPTTIGANVNAVYEELIRKGLNPTDLHVRNESGSMQKIIFPGAIVTYQGKELPLHLLTSQLNTAPEEALNNSIQSLEYNISSSIRRLVAIEKPSIAFLEG